MADQVAAKAPGRLKALGSKVRATARELEAEGDSRWPVPLGHLADRLEGGALALLRSVDPGGERGAGAESEGEADEPVSGDQGGLIARAHRATLAVADLDSIPQHAQVALRASADLLAGLMPEMDAAEATVELTRKERNLLGELAAERLFWLGDELMFTKGALKTVKQPAHRVAHLTALLDAIGWRPKVKKKRAAPRQWTVPTAVLLPALDALIEEARTERRAVAETIERARRDIEGPKMLARWERTLERLHHLRERATEGRRS